MTAQPVIIGVQLGSPNTASQVPVTTQDGAQYITLAVADLATLTTNIGTAQTDSTASDNDMATLTGSLGTGVTNINTVKTDTATAKGDATTADTDVGTAQTNFDTAMNSLVTGMGVVTYSSMTHQFSGTFSGSVTVTQTNGNNLIAALNTALTALIAAKTATALTVTDATTADTAAATAQTQVSLCQTQGASTKVATAAAKAADAALSTSAVSTDLTNASAVLAQNVLIRTDKGVCLTASELNGALVAALALVTANAILP